MLAVWYEKVGVARKVLKIGDVEEPVPQLGEVRIRLYASGVNPSDVKTRAGARGDLKVPRQIPNSDGAGVIDMVGEGIDRARMGERVWVFNAAFQRANGTAAQFVCVPHTRAVPLPHKLDFDHGACLGIPVMTAHRCVFADGAVTGQKILVIGGAGVVAHYAIQLAKWGGAEVYTTVSSAEKAKHAKLAGADHVINYRDDDVVTSIQSLTQNTGIDRVIEVEGGTNLATSIKTVKPDTGVIVVYGSSTGHITLPFFDGVIKNPIIRPVLVYTMSETAKREAQQDIEKWCDGGQAKFTIAKRLPLNEIVAANEFVEAGAKIGHVVLEIPQL